MSAGVQDTSVNGFQHQLLLVLQPKKPTDSDAIVTKQAFSNFLNAGTTATNSVPPFDFSIDVVSINGGPAAARASNNTDGYYAVLFFGCFLGALCSGLTVGKCVALAAGRKKRGGEKERGERAPRVIERDNAIITWKSGETFL